MDVIEIVDNIHTNINMDYEIESVTISLSNEDAKCSVRLRQYDSVAWTYTDNGITVVAPWDVKKPLATPNITNAASTHNSITLSWERDWSAINYILVLKKSEDVIQTAYTSGNTYTFGSLDPETLYTVELTAVSKIGATAFTSANIETTKEPVVGDGVAPATPTGLNLAAIYRNGRSYIQASWNENSESDMLGYEVQWSYDDTNWLMLGLSNTNALTFEVTNDATIHTDYTVYVQIRAVDIEGFKSDWTASVSETVQRDTTAPSVPGSISAFGGIGLIYIDWSAVLDTPDLDYYQLQRCVQTSDGGAFGSWTALAALKSTDFVDEDVEYHIQNSPEDGTYSNKWRKYKYRVRAVDRAGNGSDYRELSTPVYASQANGPDIAVNA